MNERTKKIGIVTVCSLILVAMVVALAIGSRGGGDDEIPDVSSSQKAITTICETTDYQQSCVEALKSSESNSTDPKELIEIAFQAAIKYINKAAEKSTVLQKVESDPRARSALESCRELTQRAANDLERSYAEFNNFDIINVGDILVELKIWLSGAITNEETCLDGFEDVPGDAGRKMRDALKTAMEMTSNALAMVAEIATYLETLGIQGFQSRRLLSEDFLPVLGHGDEGLPSWMDFDTRRLLSASPQQIRPNLVVAKDGSGKYRTINEALKDIPKNNNKTFVLYIKEGVYEEKVSFNSSLTHLMIIGDGPTKTRLTGKLNFIDGTGTYHTATVAVQADNFIARDVGFENSAGPEKHQAVALRVSADRAIFYNCHMDGYQDTLYVHTYRQFYRDCVISGTIDFIFGDSAAVFQGCTLLVRKPMDNQQNIVTAQGRKDVRQPTGIVLQNCTFKADPEYYPYRDKIKSYLGRPWKEYSRTIIMESYIDDFIQPQGWLKWNETFALQTLFYTEFNNRGPGAPKTQRAKWVGVKELPPTRIQRFTASEFLDGNRWIPPTRVPYASSFIFPVPKEDPNINYSPIVPEETKDLGISVNKTSYVAPRNSSNSEKPPLVSPPPPPVVPAPEIAIPYDILPSDVSPSPSPISNNIPELVITKEYPNINYSHVVPEETNDLGVSVDKTSNVAARNNFSPEKQNVSEPPPISPPPPLVPAPEIAIPSVILPNNISPSPSPISNNIPKFVIAASPSSSPIGSPILSSVSPVSGDSVAIPESITTTATPPTDGFWVRTSQQDIAYSPSTPPNHGEEDTSATPSPQSDIAITSIMSASPPTSNMAALWSPAGSPRGSESGNVAATPESLGSFQEASSPN